MSDPAPTTDAHVVTALLSEVAATVIPVPSEVVEMDRMDPVGRVQELLVVARQRAALVAHLIAALGAWDGRALP